jgi:hypothetical protein
LNPALYPFLNLALNPLLNPALNPFLNPALNPFLNPALKTLPIQLALNVLIVPLEVLQVLHPLKERHHHASTISIDVREDWDAPRP